MADPTKQLHHINGGTLISDLKSLFSFRTKSTVAFAYGFMFAFIVFTIFLVFNPSQNAISSSNASSYGSQFSTFFSQFFPNSSPLLQNSTSTRSLNITFEKPKVEKYPSIAQNQTQKPEAKQSTIEPEKSLDRTMILSNGSQNATGFADKRIDDKGLVSNFTNITSELKKQNDNGTNLGEKQGSEDLVKYLMKCDLFDGEWIRDESYPLYKPGSCSLIDEQFNCFANGRPDNDYHKLKWKPKGCTLPRLNGSHMLELLRGKRLVFVGDSLNRNMWESLICILRNSVKNQSAVYEASGRQNFRSEPSFSFIFQDYNCTVEFFVSPFLVQEWEMLEKNGSKKETLRLDLIGSSSDGYKSADIIIFNTGHWWTHDKTSKGKDYYQEGSHVYDELNVLEAFRKALTTWARWVDANVNPIKSLVFFRGYSASHFSGGQWNSGGQCDNETEPIRNETYLTPYPPKMTVLENVLKGMKTQVSYLNITRLTDYRKDGHPSIYRKQHYTHYTEEEKKAPLLFQDCSHWCLPGVPDAWNELLYAGLLVKEYQKQHEEKKRT
ncbi:hypothetical protein LguiA_014505 [Lonicera macranthoides]